MIAEGDSTFWVAFGERPLVKPRLGTTGSLGARVDALHLARASIGRRSSVVPDRGGSRVSDFAGVQTLYQEVPLPEYWPVMDQIMRDGSRFWIRLPRIADTVEGVCVVSVTG
jgi:hypothetical protein